MPTAIYISGLGQSANKESVEKYVTRYIKEIRILHFRDKLLYQSRKNLLQQNVPILLGRIQIRTVLHKINIQQNERTKLFFNNNISKQKHHLLCHPDEGRVT